jgi:integrase/recombinase XerD
LSQKTILNHWIALSSFWTWVERDLGLPHIIRGKVNRPRPRRRLSAAYTEAEIRELLAACDRGAGWDRAHGQRMEVKRPSALRDRALILVLLDTGIRASKLTALKLRDYEPKRGQLIIHHGKGDKKRVVFLGTAVKQGLWRYLVTRPGTKQDDPLFATREGAVMQRTGLRLLIFRIGTRAGARADAEVHRFRHTFAVNFLRNGDNLLALQDLLGHEHMDTVRIYAKQAEVDLERQQKGVSPADRWKL